LSTAEFSGANKTCGVGGVGCAPEINSEAEEDEKIEGLGGAMPGAEGLDGIFALIGGGVDGVFDGVELFEARLEPVVSNEDEEEKGEDQTEPELLEWFTEVEPFGNEMEEGEEPASDLQMEIAGYEDLGDGAREVGIIFGTEELAHGIGEETWAGAEGKKDCASQPDGGIEDADESQERNHRKPVTSYELRGVNELRSTTTGVAGELATN
jgi:hypothetical protein